MSTFNLTNKVKIVLKHEYISKVKSKAFLIGTFVAPIGLVIFFGLMIAASVLFNDTTEKKLAVLDETNNIGQVLVNADTSKYYLTEKSADELSKLTKSEKIDGYIIIKKNILDSGKVPIFTQGGGGIGYVTLLEKHLSSIVRKERLERSGTPEEVIKLVDSGIELETQKITDEGIKDDKTAALAFIGYALGFIIYILMFVYGNQIFRSVLEEKSNRIVEIILSSARPFDILLGKVLGIGLVGLTQVFAWITIAGVLFALSGQIVGMFVDIDPTSLQSGMTMQDAQAQQIQSVMSNFPEISPWLIVGFVFYFLAGYFIYACLFAAVGSAVDNEQDAQQLMFPVTMPIIIPIALIPMIMQNPDSVAAVAVSLFPLFSPILMIVRIASTQVPIWQIISSVVILILSFLSIIWLTAKIYRIGILMTGKKPKFSDLVKWIKMS